MFLKQNRKWVFEGVKSVPFGCGVEAALAEVAHGGAELGSAGFFGSHC